MKCRSKSNLTDRICWTIKKTRCYIATDAANDQSIFTLKTLEKSKKQD